MSVKNCKACDHFCDSGQAIGTCRRYPLYQTRSPNEWCGEFTPVAYSEPVPEMLALPVREMSTMAQVNEAFDKAYEEHTKTKRKYTKKVKA
jgi:hypothetical protein